MDAPEELWVFGYGSLIWHPGIAVAETRRASLRGFRRGFCMWSIHHRGTEENPGLVLALEPNKDARCDGLAIRAADPKAALAELRERELVSSAYIEVAVKLTSEQGDINALAYVVDTTHQQYAPHLTLEEQARIISGATGGRGPNREYLHNTARALDETGIVDTDIAALCKMVPN